MQCILVCCWNLFTCSGGLLLKFRVLKNKSLPEGTRAFQCKRAISDLNGSISQKLIPWAETVDKWVPAEGKDTHLQGMVPLQLNMVVSSNLEFTHRSGFQRGWPPNTEKVKWRLGRLQLNVCEHLFENLYFGKKLHWTAAMLANISGLACPVFFLTPLLPL